MRFHTFACVACTGQLLLAVAFSVVAANMLQAQTVVPGTGERVLGAGDNFEDTSWEFQNHFPKGSHNVDGQIREPRGISKNGLWYESAKRGQPDVLKRVAPPAGGLLGSKGAQLMRTLYSAIPERVGRGSHQDDLLFDTSPAIPVSQSPSVVVCVYLSPLDEWENHTGTSFGLRTAIEATVWQRSKGIFFSRRVRKRETYFPGIFIQFNSQTAGQEKDSAIFILRGGDDGKDYLGPEITQTGWWTLGISFTSDGRAHYYASPGVDDLKPEDRIAFFAVRSLRAVLHVLL